MHLSYHDLLLEEASQLLKASLVTQQQPPNSSHETSPNQCLVDEVVNPIQYSVNLTPPLKGEFNTTHFFFVG